VFLAFRKRNRKSQAGETSLLNTNVGRLPGTRQLLPKTNKPGLSDINGYII
jgi:hypothetical protein